MFPLIDFKRGKMSVSSVIELVKNTENPDYATADGIRYVDALEFADMLIEYGDRGQQLKAALEKMKAEHAKKALS